jgi:hypothetical protein
MNQMDDLINRQAAIEHFQRIIDATNTDGSYNLGFIDGLEFCIYDLSTMPSIQSEQKKGKWIDARDYCGEFMCSNCHETNINNFYKYCPYCGAQMEVY